jgi:hypothetical protein
MREVDANSTVDHKASGLKRRMGHRLIVGREDEFKTRISGMGGVRYWTNLYFQHLGGAFGIHD